MISLANFLENRIVRNGGEQQHTATNLYGIISKYPISLLACIKICLGNLYKALSQDGMLDIGLGFISINNTIVI